MYNVKLNKDMYLSAILDYALNVKEIAKFGIKINKYINSGVLLMDLKTMEKNQSKRYCEILLEHII